MKKTLVVTVIAFLFAAFHASAKKVDEQTAMNLASKMMQSRVMAKKRIANPSLRHNAAVTASPAYYLFAGENGRGFVVVSAEDAVRPILAYSETSSLDNMPEAMQLWLNDMENQIYTVREMNLQPTEKVQAMWRRASIGDVVVELKTADWGQNAPFNDKCPSYNGKHCLTGCVGTAHAILMKYYEYPKAGTGTAPSYRTTSNNIGVRSRNLEHDYIWDDMPLSYNGGTTTAQNSAVSQLMADIGASIQLDYGINETFGYLGKFSVLKNFGYSLGEYYNRSSYTDSEWHSMMQKQLDEGCPIMYRAARQDGSGGHVFIVDGYSSDQYYRVNWGWNGNCNGYFLLDAFVPYEGYDISFGQGAQFGLKPLELVKDNYVAKVGDKQYASVLTALAASSIYGEKAVMIADAELGETSIKEECSLDLNGHKITTKEWIGNYSKFTVSDSGNDGSFIENSNDACIENHAELTIEGGRFENNCKYFTGDYDYRRAIWSNAGTKTIINGGTFVNAYGVQTLCFNGDAVINGGKVVQSGTYPTIVNFSQDGKLVINDGEFINDAPSELDGNHAVVWTDDGTKVEINGGTFMTYHGTVALSFNGDAIVNNATVTCPNGDDCDSWGGLCVLTNVKFGGFWNVYGGEGSDRIQIVSGYFSREVEPQYIAEGSWMITNPYSASKQQYPYMVINKELPVTPEDVNGDGNVDTQDVLDIYEHMRNGDPQKECDVNKDGTTDTQDVLSAYEYMKNH